jgi:hypothetical protein
MVTLPNWVVTTRSRASSSSSRSSSESEIAAASLLVLEQEGVLGPHNGSKSRDVLVKGPADTEGGEQA